MAIQDFKDIMTSFVLIFFVVGSMFGVPHCFGAKLALAVSFNNSLLSPISFYIYFMT